MRHTNTLQIVPNLKIPMAIIVIMLLMVSSGTIQAKEYRMSTAIGNPNSTLVKPVDLSGVSTSTHELALMQVLAEVCPRLIRSNLRPRFAYAYNTKLHQLMPTVANPDNAMRYLATQKEYQRVHKNIKNWTLSYSPAENKAMCEELVTTHF